MIDKYILLRGKDYQINEKTIIHHPTLEEIFEFGGDKYLGIVSALTAVPFDYKVQLYDMKIDYESLSDYELFSIIFNDFIKSKLDMSILFNFNIADFKLYIDENKKPFFYNDEQQIMINELVYMKIVDFIRDINYLSRNNDYAGNAHMKKYLIDKERKKLLKNRNNKSNNNQLLDMVSAMVNSKEFKYDWDSVWKLPIYVFNDSVRTISKIKNVENIMTGIYTGNIKSSDIPQEQLNWLSNHE